MMALPSLWGVRRSSGQEQFANVHYRRAFLLLTGNSNLFWTRVVNILSIASLLFRPKTTFVAAGELQIYRERVSRNARRNNLAGYTAPALPMLSKTFRQVRKTGNSRWNGGTFLGDR